MALNIRNRKAEELAAAVVELTGESKTEAVTKALEERLDRLQQRRQLRSQRRADELNEIALHCAALPVFDNKTAEEISGYDDRELPT